MDNWESQLRQLALFAIGNHTKAKNHVFVFGYSLYSKQAFKKN